ncbi:MAG: exonuclease SbcCD subunit D [Bacteroidales bacterium]|nr:exonuclease SbcCD subunit D [Bacteroidales bacterium]
MLKILHTSDWHLGNQPSGYDRSVSEAYFLEQLKEIVEREQPDCMIVSGDIYNLSSPSAAVQKMYTNAMLEIHNTCPNMTIIVIAGNHDSPSKLEIDSNLWSCFNVFVTGSIEKRNDTVDFKRHIIEIKNKNRETVGYVAAIPYFYIRNYPNLFENLEEYIKSTVDLRLPIVLTCHLAVSGSEIRSNNPHVADMEFFPLEMLGEIYDYIALGHIHLPQTLKNSNAKARYSGSPLSISFNENYPHSVTVAEISGKNSLNTRTIDIKDNMPLITVPKESGSIEEVFQYAETHKDSLKNCFIRFNVKVKDFLPSNSKEKAIELCESIGAYFCTFNIERKSNDVQKNDKTVTVEEFKQMSVMDVARSYMRNQNINADDDLIRMLSYAINFNQDDN